MNRSTLRSFGFVLATTVIGLSFSPLAASAQTLPATAPTVDQSHYDIVYGDGDEGAIYVGPISTTAQRPTVTLGPGDVLFADNDEGAIAQGPALQETYAAPEEIAAAPARLDVMFTGDDAGGMPVDLSAFHGRSNITMAELSGASAPASLGVTDFGGNGCD